MKESWLDVKLCQEGSEGCQASNSTSGAGVLKFPKRSNEEKVIELNLSLYAYVHGGARTSSLNFQISFVFLIFTLNMRPFLDLLFAENS